MLQNKTGWKKRPREEVQWGGGDKGSDVKEKKRGGTTQTALSKHERIKKKKKKERILKEGKTHQTVCPARARGTDASTEPPSDCGGRDYPGKENEKKLKTAKT